ncbi:hypothetical protein [Bradyrhizobium sp. LA2.1]|uniref:hypothetical protein n=1 Tax=Bradyrhizobium sp. LA2.1 TaxID=3156376 RepID=UPI003393CB5C
MAEASTSSFASLLANAADTKADFDFGKLNKSYWEGKDQFAKNELRDAFRDGLPLDANGQPDWGTMSKVLIQKGGLEQGVAAANLDVSRQQLAAGQRDRALYAGGGSGQPAPIVSPPSSNRGASVAVAAPLNRGGEQPSTAAQPPAAPKGGTTIGQYLMAAGIPNDQIGTAGASIARQLGVDDPNAQIDTNDIRIRNVLVPAVQQLKRMGIGQVVQQQPQTAQIAPPQAPQPAQAIPQPPQPPATAQVAPDFNSRFSAARPGQADAELARLRYLSGSTDKGTAEAARAELKIRLEGQQPPNEVKLYNQAVSQGFKGTFEDWQNRTDENTTQRDILTKSILPRIDKSQETATAARDDIDSIHRARAELDKPGGIINGAFADKRLFLAKAANLLGVPNADKINNTEAYGAAIGQRVASMVKAFGSGTAISDGDRRFAAAMAGGNIELDEKSMRRILDIGEKAARGKIDYHNTSVDKVVNANDALKPARDTFLVKAPDAYQKAAAPDPYEKARDAISKGAPRDAVMQRLQKAGFDPTKL